jgi:hypothetical protein
MFTALARTLLAIGSALLPLVALGSASGTCTAGTEKTTIVDGVIYKVPNSSEEGKSDIVVELASSKLDAAKIAAAKDPEAAVHDQLWDANLPGHLRLTIGDGAVRRYFVHVPPGSNETHFGSNNFGDLKLSRSDAKGVAGHFAFKGKATDDASCDVSFDLNF